MITCPGDPQLESILRKSIPLILDYKDKEPMNMWLDHTLTDAFSFDYLLTNNITQYLIATPIVGECNLEPRGSEILLHKDQLCSQLLRTSQLY